MPSNMSPSVTAVEIIIHRQVSEQEGISGPKEVKTQEQHMTMPTSKDT